jgi:uncharacterized membrane protein YdbT with pleckstrin-like domain
VSEKTLYEQHPAMFRNQPIGFILCVILSFVGLGLIIFLFWWLQSKGTTLTVTDHRTILRRGILSKHINEVYHSDIRNVQIYQSFLQRIFGVGTISIASAGSGEAEIVVPGMRDPGKVKEILDAGRREKRTGE